jgi:hypothetical protein
MNSDRHGHPFDVARQNLPHDPPASGRRRPGRRCCRLLPVYRAGRQRQWNGERNDLPAWASGRPRRTRNPWSAWSLRVVKEYERGVVYRFERVRAKPLRAGLAFIVPMVDRL